MKSSEPMHEVSQTEKTAPSVGSTPLFGTALDTLELERLRNDPVAMKRRKCEFHVRIQPLIRKLADLEMLFATRSAIQYPDGRVEWTTTYPPEIETGRQQLITLIHTIGKEMFGDLYQPMD